MSQPIPVKPGDNTRPAAQPAAGASDQLKAGQEGVGFLVNQTTRAFSWHISKEIRQFNIQLPGYVVLRHLLREIEASPNGVPVPDLAEKLLMDPALVLDAAERLERDGWLKMAGMGAHSTLKPTAKAYKIAPVLASASRWMLEEALNGFSRDEIDQLSSMLRRILRNLDAPLGKDEGPLGR
jgi:DNA-binding MarR family transcriptional regulator